jgi:predicted SnoaL-like aldol condensation-catalyzing enzyme
MTRELDGDIGSRGALPTEAERAAAERWVAGFAERWAPLDAERLRDLMHPDTRNLIPPMTAPADCDGVVAHFAAVQAQLPGLRLDVVRWAATGDAVFVEWMATAQLGPRTLQWRGIDRVRLRGERTYEGEAFWDTRRLAQVIAELRGGTQPSGRSA